MYNTILVATKSGEQPSECETQALRLAKLCGARCVLVHVIEPIEAGGDDTIEEFFRTLEERARVRLAKSVSRFKEAGVGCETRVLIAKRWLGIVETAEEVDADLLVLGSRPLIHEGKPRLGTTSHQVFLAATCPLLIVRSSTSQA